MDRVLELIKVSQDAEERAHICLPCGPCFPDFCHICTPSVCTVS